MPVALSLLLQNHQESFDIDKLVSVTLLHLSLACQSNPYTTTNRHNLEEKVHPGQIAWSIERDGVEVPSRLSATPHSTTDLPQVILTLLCSSPVRTSTARSIVEDCLHHRNPISRRHERNYALET
eukprot:CCRYP_010375-RA/>CCRYP_010375-RA protein AED:0.28 eAED:0.28 QI:0/0.5/0.33/1/0/0/3/1636/124